MHLLQCRMNAQMNEILSWDMPHVPRHQTKRGLLTQTNPVQYVPHVQESTCNLTKIYIKAENCAIYLNGKDQPTWIILDGKVLS